mgnify:FL=1
MNIDELNKYVMEEIKNAEEYGENVTIRLYLSNDDNIEIWFDEENDCYTWSNASFGYEDTDSVVQDIIKWLDNECLNVMEIELI